MTGTLAYAVANGIARLTITQPDRLNAMTLAMWQAVPELVARAEADPQVRLLALAGAGTAAFCAGADISRFWAERSGAAAVKAYDADVARAETALAQASKPTLALVRGICFGGGIGLALACDLRLADTAARFRIPAARLGIGYAPQGVARCVRRLGLAATAELLFTARIFSADEALAQGLVSRIFANDSFGAQSAEYLAMIVQNAPLSLRAAKATLTELEKPEAQRDFSRAEAMVAACYDSADYAEGQQAFLDKRPPQFTGR